METKRLFSTLALLLMLVSSVSTVHAGPARQRFQLPEDVAQRSVDIISEGTRMTGYVFVAKSAGAKEQLPAIVMAQGWGGKQISLFRDAAEFAQSGYFVLTFDYRGWGQSDSRVILTGPAKDHKSVTFTAEVRAIREVVDPLDMGTDWLNVLHWVQGEGQVDTDRIGIWGSSMAGGYAVYAAAHDPRVRAVHSQVTGTLDGHAWGHSKQARRQATKRARKEIGYPQPLENFNGLNGAPIMPRFARYRPAEDILLTDKVALQIVLAEEEQYGTNPKAMSTFEAYKGPKNLVVIPKIKHYGIYREGRKQAHELAEAWFDKYLKFEN